MSGPLRPWLFLAARSAPPKPFAASTARIPNRRLSFTNERYPITLIFQPPATQFVFGFVLYPTPDLFRVMLKMAHEYKLLVRMSRNLESF
jgi:hypothetical protein